MTELVYLDDSYLKELETTVLAVEDDGLVLEKTIFYVQGGGQPFDTGVLVKGDEEHKVLSVKKKDGTVFHKVEGDHSLSPNDTVFCKIDWERRYRLMRMHTTAHILSSLFYKKAGALITGNQLDIEKSRIDFSMDDFDKEKIKDYVDLANELVEKGGEVTVSTLPREEAMKLPDVVKLANILPPQISQLRIVKIADIDTQADGGTHVKDIKEIKKISLVSAENKGKNNRRVYFTVD